MTRSSALIDSAIRYNNVVFENQGTLNLQRGADTIVREGTRFVYDDRAHLARWTLGDLLPVRLLEQLPRRERNARISLLRNRYTGRARWLHIVMMHFEMLLMAAMISMVFWFAPATQAEWLWLQLSQTDSVPTGCDSEAARRSKRSA